MRTPPPVQIQVEGLQRLIFVTSTVSIDATPVGA